MAFFANLRNYKYNIPNESTVTAKIPTNTDTATSSDSSICCVAAIVPIRGHGVAS